MPEEADFSGAIKVHSGLIEKGICEDGFLFWLLGPTHELNNETFPQSELIKITIAKVGN
ncbi:MAG: hypothetical protein ACI9WC_001233 [Arenicella sp.]|jgi:hypothetical protein